MSYVKCAGCGADIVSSQDQDQTLGIIITAKVSYSNGNPVYTFVPWHSSCFFKYVLKNTSIDNVLTTLQSEFGINKKYSGAKDNSKSLAEFLSYLIMAYQSMKSDYDVEEACKVLKETANKLRAEGNKKGAEKIEKAMRGMCERFL
jgi:hypothetical protein